LLVPGFEVDEDATSYQSAMFMPVVQSWHLVLAGRGY
jgi:hypothetical protein